MQFVGPWIQQDGTKFLVKLENTTVSASLGFQSSSVKVNMCSALVLMFSRNI